MHSDVREKRKADVFKIWEHPLVEEQLDCCVHVNSRSHSSCRLEITIGGGMSRDSFSYVDRVVRRWRSLALQAIDLVRLELTY